MCVVPETESKNPANLEHHQPPVGNGAGEYGVRRAAASRRRHFGPVGGAATTRCPGRTAAVRELAARTGTNQTAAVEDAVARRLSELDREDRARAEARRAAAEQTLRDLDKLLSDDDKRLIRRHEVDLYDDSGLPR